MTNEELVIKIKTGDNSLMPTLWEQVERFTKQQAANYFYKHSSRCAAMGVELEDLYQEAYLAIYNAVNAYNPDKGVKFLTYANYHLLKQFNRAIKIERIDRPAPISLDTVITNFENGEANLLNILPDLAAQKKLDDVINQIYLDEIRPMIKKALDTLTPLQKDVAINCLCGGMSYTEFGRIRGANRVTIRQAAKRALKHLRAIPELTSCLY